MENDITNTSLDGSHDYSNKGYSYYYWRILYYSSCTIICINLPLTLLAIYALYSLVRKDHTAPIYVINLLLSDLIQLGCMIAVVGYFEFDPILVYFYIHSLMASVGNMVCLSLERYMAIACPLKNFMNSIKISVMVCVMVWALPLIFVLPLFFMVDYRVTVSIFGIFFLLPCPLFLFFLGGTLKVLPISTAVPSTEKRQIVGILVLVLLIYTLLFLPFIIWFLSDSGRRVYSLIRIMFVLLRVTSFKTLLRFLIQLRPLADLVLCVFMSKGTVDKLLASLSCCKMDCSDVKISTV